MIIRNQVQSELTCLSLNRDFQRPSHVFSEQADRNMRFFNPLSYRLRTAAYLAKIRKNRAPAPPIDLTR
jgi:hypothetical protein